MVKIAAYVEGPTEWYTIYQLYEKKILQHAELDGYSVHNDIERWMKSPRNVLKKISSEDSYKPNNILLLYDQERDNSPVDAAKKIAGNITTLNKIDRYDNVFSGLLNDKIRIVLHIATISGPNGNKDFDGYIVQILKHLESIAVQKWFEYNKIPKYIKRHREVQQVEYEKIHQLGFYEIPKLMEKHKWNILLSKGNLYSYITALQVNKSHVWFAENMIKYAPKEVLEEVFAPLITAWNLLAEEANQ